MNRVWIFLVVNSLLVSVCAADTFTNRQNGDSFNGYPTQQSRGGKTLVRSESSSEPRWINLADYEVQWNFKGRKHVVITLSIKNKIELESETAAFEKAMEQAANQGPLFVVIQIDTPGGRIDLMKRICAAISKTKNCHTVAYICGGNYGGAYSAGAHIALACKEIYMADNTVIGAATTIILTKSGVKDLKAEYGEIVGEKYMSAARAYIASLAEENGRSGALAKAMVDKEIEVLEVVDKDKKLFVESNEKKADQSTVRVWNKKGSLLTLTAAEAVECGMADGVINSTDELLSRLGAAGVRIVQKNEGTIKSRHEYEKYKKDFEKLMIQVDGTVKEVERLSGNIDSMSSPNQARQRQTQIRNFAKNIRTLISQVREAIDLNKRCPDLNLDVEEAEKAINSLEAAYRQVQEQLKH